jgi:hypothetical protein
MGAMVAAFARSISLSFLSPRRLSRLPLTIINGPSRVPDGDRGSSWSSFGKLAAGREYLMAGRVAAPREALIFALPDSDLSLIHVPWSVLDWRRYRGSYSAL